MHSHSCALRDVNWLSVVSHSDEMRFFSGGRGEERGRRSGGAEEFEGDVGGEGGPAGVEDFESVSG